MNIPHTYTNNLFVIIATIKTSKERVHDVIEDHMAFVKEQKRAGIYITGGPKVPYDGSVVIAQGANLEFIQEIINSDPGKTQEIYDYEIIEFSPRFFQAPN